MAIDINHIQHDNYLEFKITGSYDLSDAIDTFKQILIICRLEKVSKVLIDYRELKSDIGGTEKTLYAFAAEDEYLKYLGTGGQELQIAYLAPALHTYEPGAEIGKRVERLKFELFEDLYEALEWLDIKNR
jgi:hypothetical protein